MIELTNIKTTDTVKQLRGQINAMQNEIMADQPFVGLCQNISIKFYDVNTLVGAVTASSLANEKLYAMCFPENNGVFVAKVWGSIYVEETPSSPWNMAIIDIPAVRIPTSDTVVTTFVSPSHFSFNGFDDPNSMSGPLGFAADNPTVSPYPLSVTLTEHDATCNVTLRSANRGGIDSSAPTLILSI